VPAGVALCAVAGSSSARIAAAIYSLTVSGVFGVSAAFHLVAWSPAGRRRMDRLDRAMIYLQIAGTYTPVNLLALGRGLAIAVLAFVWPGAVAGAALVLWRGNIRVVGLAIYMLLGWPDPDPAVFGYHEVWLTIVAGACHWTVIWLLVRSA
jgi:hemolysin III